MFRLFKRVTSLRGSCQKTLDSQPVWIEGIGHQTNCASMAHAIPEIFKIRICKLAASHAYEMAKMKPSDIQVAEIHDAFTIMEIMACEDLGFAKRGNGIRMPWTEILRSTPGEELSDPAIQLVQQGSLRYAK